MITATCTNTDCSLYAQPFFVLGQPTLVECGECATPTDMTNPEPDPEAPEE